MAVLCLTGLGALVVFAPVHVASQVDVEAAGLAHGAVSTVFDVCPAASEPDAPPQPEAPPPPVPRTPSAPPASGAPAPELPVPELPTPWPSLGAPPSPVGGPPGSAPGSPAPSVEEPALSVGSDSLEGPVRPPGGRGLFGAPVAEELAAPAPPSAPGPVFPVRPYRSALVTRPVPGGFSTVTLMVVVTAPAVLAAAALRPGGRGRSSRN
ncbi:hypothetical protein [Streptomyces indicus]|uniref:Uncharacterized protein n=1 Tax=Streptomyces indicus TaxID=417292 RepID=A0A1G8V948_9ACTN|nr:hypothetical protein [Streptomyces indicus]SDJ62533.1 hypothetical protein SAMN05421806_1011331 [Streptomyces indicus]